MAVFRQCLEIIDVVDIPAETGLHMDIRRVFKTYVGSEVGGVVVIAETVIFRNREISLDILMDITESVGELIPAACPVPLYYKVRLVIGIEIPLILLLRHFFKDRKRRRYRSG